MADRQKSRRSPAGAKRLPAKASRATAAGRSEQECDKLVAELAEARARIAALEQAQTAALDRIDWALDSLHSLLENEP